jgi:hypothetical protein
MRNTRATRPGDVLTGGRASDRFVFSGDFGHNAMADFTDHIEVGKRRSFNICGPASRALRFRIFSARSAAVT